MFYLFALILLIFPSLETIKAKHTTETTTAKAASEPPKNVTVSTTTKKPANVTKPPDVSKPSTNVTASTEPAKTEIVTTPPTTTEAWSTPLILSLNGTKSSRHKRKGRKKKEECHGWCLNGNNFTIHLKITLDPQGDDKKKTRFYMVKSQVDKYAKFPVRLAVNVYADKNQYADLIKSRSRAKLFEKNLIQIPTGIFFPYTRNAVRKAIYDSGHIYVPHQRKQTAMITRAISHPFEDTPLTFLMSDQRFTNDYFESNPLLSTRTRFAKLRRKSAGLSDNLVSSDPFNIDSDKSAEKDVADKENDAKSVDGYRRKKGVPSLRSIRLKEFLHNSGKARAKQRSSGAEIRSILGVKGEDSVLQHSRATVDDIVGGMKLNSKNNLFLIGVTKSARSNIIKWVGKRSRSGKLGKGKDTGVVVSGSARSGVINEVLRSMMTNYQYGDRKHVYKRITDVH